MQGLIKNKHHKWCFRDQYRLSHKKVSVHQCLRCGCIRNTYLDSLTHSHVKTEYINGKEVTSKVPECFQVSNVLF